MSNIVVKSKKEQENVSICTTTFPCSVKREIGGQNSNLAYTLKSLYQNKHPFKIQVKITTTSR